MPREREPGNERVTIGDERVSITLIHKTEGDFIVSQTSSERWFKTPEAAIHALQRAVDALISTGDDGGGLLGDGGDHG